MESYETIINYIRTTKTATGLRVRAHLVRKLYKKGVKITDKKMEELCITKDEALPNWNYSIKPST